MHWSISPLSLSLFLTCSALCVVYELVHTSLLHTPGLHTTVVIILLASIHTSLYSSTRVCIVSIMLSADDLSLGGGVHHECTMHIARNS